VLVSSLGCAALVSIVLAIAMAWRGAPDAALPGPVGRGFGLLDALLFAFIFCLVTLASSALHEASGGAGVVLVSTLAAFVDAHSTAASLASLHRAGNLDAQTAELAILLALSANSVTKIVLAFSGRHFRFGLLVTAGVLLVAAAAWSGRLLL
jgi:uncharacterized membrane protein (DUF4010 family)